MLLDFFWTIYSNSCDQLSKAQLKMTHIEMPLITKYDLFEGMHVHVVQKITSNVKKFK